WPTVLLRLKLAAIVLVAVVGVLMLRVRRDWRSFLVARATRAQAIAAFAGVLGAAWFVVIAIMTQIGFSGNNRYLVIGSALVEICGAVAWGWAAQEFGNLIASALRRGRAAASRALTLGAGLTGVGLVGLAFLLLPSWVGGNLIDIPVTHRSIVYQASL